ncbi:zinc finger, C2H2-like protein [Artemisia annua]|uniref:Zinc finger, C2H2-like protein n=1 Tax=Artemisia annua TaxID=35608 RepID=A0A2U1N5W4_ARTAN|nr:zinc finger, C2H2-like protein [Artemisia annua]
MALEALNSPTTPAAPPSLHKGKRSKRPRVTMDDNNLVLPQHASEEEYLAICLMLLARGSPTAAISTTTQPPHDTYKCSVCNKGTFPTGQALGGHKRRHYDGGSGGVTSSDGGATSSTAPSQVVQRDFDLNLPAMLPGFQLGLSVDCGKKSQLLLANEQEVESPLPSKKPRFSTMEDRKLLLKLEMEH